MNNRKMTQSEYALTLLPYDAQMTFDTLITMPKGALYRWIKKTKQVRKEVHQHENEELAREYEELCKEHKNDLRAVAEEMTALNKKSVHEYEGACPLCKDQNGFFVSERDYDHWWNCRACQKGGDVAALLMEKNNINFWEAVEELAGYSPRDKAKITPLRTYTIVTPINAPNEKPKELADFTSEFNACLQTFQENSLTAFAYFEGKRGLARETVLFNRIGMKRTHRGLAIIYPSERLVNGNWQITAYNRRFLDKVKLCERKKKPKTMLVKNGNWGIYRLRRIKGALCLLVVEGEENALSVWETVRAQGWACDVASIGCQDNFKSLRDDMTKCCNEYQHLLIWADEQKIADKAIDMYRHESSLAIYSPQLAGFDSALDANDLLLNDKLTEFLSCYLSRLSATLIIPQEKEEKQRKIKFTTGQSLTDNNTTQESINWDAETSHRFEEENEVLWAKYAAEFSEDDAAADAATTPDFCTDSTVSDELLYLCVELCEQHLDYEQAKAWYLAAERHYMHGDFTSQLECIDAIQLAISQNIEPDFPKLPPPRPDYDDFPVIEPTAFHEWVWAVRAVKLGHQEYLGVAWEWARKISDRKTKEAALRETSSLAECANTEQLALL